MGRNNCVRAVTAVLTMAFAGIVLMGCTGRAVSPGDLAAINRRSNALVLLRIVGESDSGEPPAIMGTSMGGEGVVIGIGDFDSGGAPKECHWFAPFALGYYCKSLSEEARARGWIALTLSPGYYYLAIKPPHKAGTPEPYPPFSGLPRWRIEVPAETPVVYAGTFHLHTVPNPTLFGGHFYIRQEATRIEDEQDEVLTVARRDLPSLPAPVTRLSELQTGPLLFGVPRPNKKP